MSNFSRDVLMALSPDGSAWVPVTDDDYDKLLEGVSENSESVRLDLASLRYLRDPARTPILSDLEKEYGIIPHPTATEAERRQWLASVMYKRNTKPTYELLEEKLQGAGFDVHVWPNDPTIDPSVFTVRNFNMTCGDVLPSGNDAQCGEPEALCAFIGGELLVNGEQFQQSPNYIVQCNDLNGSQCGSAADGPYAGDFDKMRLTPITYEVPTDPGYWPMIFIVGGSRSRAANYNTGASNTIRVIAIQSDGKIIIGGEFTKYRGEARNYIARLNSDGTLDTTFNPGTGASNSIYSIVIQTDGKILIGGAFTAYNNYPRNHIARLNTDGSLDTSFDPGTGASLSINSIALQSDGKIIIGGAFLLYNGTSRSKIARLNTDGTLDTTFTPGTGVADDVYSVAVQSSDQKIIIGGAFTSFNGSTINRIARLTTTGTLDGTFTPGTGADSWIFALALQSDGKILIGGIFTSYDGTGRARIARLNAVGTLDTAFDPGTGANSDVHVITLQSDGKILIGGDFTTYNGNLNNHIARLNSDGTLDTSFEIGTGASGLIDAITLQSDGKILIGGSFGYFNMVPRGCIALLEAAGGVNDAFNYDTSIGYASVPSVRRAEFRRLILQYKPMASWGVLAVVYT